VKVVANDLHLEGLGKLQKTKLRKLMRVLIGAWVGLRAAVILMFMMFSHHLYHPHSRYLYTHYGTVFCKRRRYGPSVVVVWLVRWYDRLAR